MSEGPYFVNARTLTQPNLLGGVVALTAVVLLGWLNLRSVYDPFTLIDGSQGLKDTALVFVSIFVVRFVIRRNYC